MTTTTTLRSRYLGTQVATATPGQLLTMLYDRLLVDLAQAEQALLAGDQPAARLPLQHAQDILLELLGSLDVSAWEAGPALASLYGFCVSELMAAHLEAAPGRVTTCIALLEPLRLAWHEAAVQTALAEEPVAVGAGGRR